MARENFDVEVPEGSHLGFSRDTDGAYRAHLFDDETNELVGHAELFEPDANSDAGSTMAPDPVFIYVDNERSDSRADDTEVQDVLAALALLGIIVAAQKAAPHLKRWWNARALPFLKNARSKLSRMHKPNGSRIVQAEVPALDESAPAGSAQAVLSALDEYRRSMSSAEARERFIAALVARLFSEQQFSLLREARIEDQSGSLELASAIETLTPQQLEDSIRLMLESNPSWPNQETLAELGNLLGDGRIDGEHVQRRKVDVRRVLRPPRSKE